MAYKAIEDSKVQLHWVKSDDCECDDCEATMITSPCELVDYGEPACGCDLVMTYDHTEIEED